MSLQQFYNFFRNADKLNVRVIICKLLQWVWAEPCYQVAYSSCIFEAKFFINGAITSATLLAHAVFASVNSSRRPIADSFVFVRHGARVLSVPEWDGSRL